MIKTFSSFYFGFNITANNQFLNFSEGGPELTAKIRIDDYTLTEIASEIENQLNNIGALTYTVSVNRSTRVITISASGTFSLLTGTGSQDGSSIFDEIGFTQSVDLTGSSSYSGESPAGDIYEPQFKLQSFVDPDTSQASVDAVVLEATDGSVETLSFGNAKFIEADIKFITNLPMDGLVIKNNPNGLSDSIRFLEFITKKRKFEFNPDANNPSSFFKVILESTPGFRDGTGFKLRELFAQNLPDFYETGILTMRVVE